MNGAFKDFNPRHHFSRLVLQEIWRRVWLMMRTSALAEWRSDKATTGKQCVTQTGPWKRLRWCVSCWSVATPWTPPAAPLSAEAAGRWWQPRIPALTMWRLFSNAHSKDSQQGRVGMNTMLVFSVLVRMRLTHPTLLRFLTKNRVDVISEHCVFSMQHSSVWSAALASALAEWRFSIKASGGLCAMTTGRWLMPMSCANSSAAASPCPLPQLPTSVKALGLYGSTTWSVWAKRPLSHIVSIPALEKITVGMAKMLVSSV